MGNSTAIIHGDINDDLNYVGEPVKLSKSPPLTSSIIGIVQSPQVTMNTHHLPWNDEKAYRIIRSTLFICFIAFYWTLDH